MNLAFLFILTLLIGQVGLHFGANMAAALKNVVVVGGSYVGMVSMH